MRHSVKRIFDELGKAVDATWDRADRDVRRFSEVACDALRASRLHQAIDHEDIMRLALDGDLPVQTRRAFGQPPVNLHVADDFLLEANFWLDGTTAIHSHGFRGAFLMLHGRSLHTTYVVREQERLNEIAAICSMDEHIVEILGPGDVREITSGNAFVHSAFHLDRPSVSVVLRTAGDAEAPPQMNFYPPSLAANRDALPEPMRTQLELFRVWGAVDPARMCRELVPWCARRGKLAAIEALRLGAEYAGATPELEALRDAVRARFPALLRAAEASAAEQRRREWIASQRARLKNEELRFFLAMLLVTNHELRAGLIGREAPGRPYAQYITDSARALAAHGVRTQVRDELAVAILGEMLAGACSADLVQRLAASLPDIGLEEQAAEIHARATAIANDPLFLGIVDEHWRINV